MDLKHSIVAILNNKNKIIGTGFVAGENLILTCAHVVEQATYGLNQRVTVRFFDHSKTEASVEPQAFSPSYEKDVALLRVSAVPSGVAPLPLSYAAGSPGHDFYAYGYARVKKIQGIGARGTIVDLVESGRMVQLKSQEPDCGMSGGPVVDEQRRVVVGIVNGDYSGEVSNPNQRNLYTTFATATEVLFEICAELSRSEICPYLSLNTFTEGDAQFFFGRTQVVERLLESLARQPRFLAVLGPSGSGKSSVVRAGLIPALRAGQLPESQTWEMLTLRPANQPFEQLAGVGLVNPEAGLKAAVEAWLAAHPDKTRLLLVIDQFEEVLVSTQSEIRQKFISELQQVLQATTVPVTLILTLRDDFYSRFLLEAADLAGWLEDGLVNTPPVLSQTDLWDMIKAPADKVGLHFQEGLVETLIADACQAAQGKNQARSTVLPLLEFTLKELWEKQEDGWLTHAAYEKIGRLAGGLSRWANQIYLELGPNERILAERIFGGLVHLGDKKDQVPDTRRVVEFHELTFGFQKKNLERVIDKLAGARLLSMQREIETGRLFVEIIHEALLHEWEQLESWINKLRHRDQLAKERRRLLIIFGLIGILIVVVALAFNALRQTQIALARQLVAQAESTNATKNSKQMISVLLATRSMQIIPSAEASQVLLYSTAARQVLKANHPGVVRSVAFSQDGKYVVSGGGDTVLVLEVATGLAVAHMRQRDLVYSVAVSPDGKLVASGGPEMAVCLWDLVTSRLIQRLPKEDGVYVVKFSPDGKYLAAGGEQAITIWETATGSQVARLKVNTGHVFALSYSLDGRWLVSGDLKHARVWDLAIGQEIARLKHNQPVNAVAFNPAGTSVISGSEDFTARVWEVATEAEVARIDHAGAVTSVAFSPDGKFVISGSRDNTARVWNPANGSELLRFNHDGSVFFAGFSPEGNYVVTTSADTTARVWEAGTGREISRMTHAGSVTSAAFSPDGKLVVSGSNDQTLRVWQTKTSAEITRKNHAGKVYAVAFSPDGQSAVSAGSDNVAQVWNVRTNAEVYRVVHPGDVYSVAFSQDGKYLVSGGGPAVIVTEVATGKEIARMKPAEAVYSVAFSPDGKFIAAGGVDAQACVWAVAANSETPRACMNHTAQVRSVAFSPDGKYVISGSDDQTARVWEALTGKEIARMTHPEKVYSVAFSPNGKYVVSGDAKAARAWDPLTGRELARISHFVYVYSVAFSPDSKYVVSGGGSTVKVWEAATGKEIANLLHDGTVNWVAFSRDGKYVVSGDDKAARVWDVLSGTELARMVHNNLVKAVAFSPDGQYVLSGGVDRTARLWIWNSEALIANACSALPRNLTRDEWKFYLNDQPYQEICLDLPTELEPYSVP
jgi:uncharacterized delta-60 repeat protein